MKQNQRGTALIAVTMVAAVLGGALAASLSVTSQRAKFQRSQSETQKALTTAEAGIDRVIALANDGQFSSLAENSTQTLSPTSILGATANITVARLADQVDAGAGTTTTTLRVESSGSFGQSQSNVVGFVRMVTTSVALTANLPTVEAAVMLGDPFAQLKMSGTSFLISGADKNIDGTNGPNAPAWGIGVGPQSDGTPGDPNGIKNQLSGSQQPLVQGQGSTPSVGSVSAVPITSIVSSLAPYADVTITNPSGTYTSNMGSYSLNQPQLTSVVGDIHISGGSTGYGVLLVNGNLTISGNWDYIGEIFVTGQVTFSGGGNTKKLTGAVFALGDSKDLTVNGNITLQYSSEAISLVTDYLATKSTTTSTPYAFVSYAEN